MQYKNDLNGSVAPIIHKFQIGEAMATEGVPVEIGTLSDTYGLLKCETTSCVDCVGVTYDAQATRNTAQDPGGVTGADPAVLVSVIVNPHALWKAQLSGGATSGTAMSLFTETVGSSTGVLLTTGAAASPYDDGYAWGYDGGNPGILRKIVDVDGTDADLIIAFPKAIAIGDTFLLTTFGPGELAGMQLTTTLEQIDATGDQQGTDNFRCVRLAGLDSGDEGRTRSWALISIFDHLFASGGSI